MCFDLTEPNTFKGIGKWLSEIEQYAEDYVQVVMVGNKSDRTSDIKVSREQVEDVLSQHPSIKYFESSAKANIGVDDAFEALVASVVKSWEENTWDK